MTKLFKFTWTTNYGERVALVEAKTQLQAEKLFDVGTLWDDVCCEQIELEGVERIISIEGGDL